MRRSQNSQTQKAPASAVTIVPAAFTAAGFTAATFTAATFTAATFTAAIITALAWSPSPAFGANTSASKIASPSVPLTKKAYDLVFPSGKPIGRVVAWTGGIQNVDITAAAGTVKVLPAYAVPALRPDEQQLKTPGYVQKIPANIEGLDLTGLDVGNELLGAIVTRCKNLRYIGLAETDVDDGAFAILAGAPGLEALDMKNDEIDGSGFSNLDKFPSLKFINLQASTVRPANYKFIPRAKKLAELRAPECAVDDAACAFIAQLPSLNSLNLAKTLVTDKGIANLAPLKDKLDFIDIANCRVGDGALKTFGQFTKLRNLTLRTDAPQPPFTAAGVQALKGAKNLKSLDIGHTIKDDVPSAAIKACPNLLMLNTSQCPGVTDAGFKQLSTMKSLNYLDISSTKCGNGALEQASRLPALGVLMMGQTKMNDAGFKRFCDNKSPVQVVLIDNNGISDAGLTSLFKLLQLRTLNVNGNAQITDAAVPHIIKCKQLASLGLVHTKISSKGIAQIKTALPNCRISFF